MPRFRSTVRRKGAGWRITPATIVAILLTIGAVVALAFQFGRAPGAGRAALSAGDDATAAAGLAASAPARESANVLERVAYMWDTAGRVEKLEAENRELKAWRQLAEQLAERNARYEALLRMPADVFGEQAVIEESVAAQLVLDSGGPFTRTVVANAGADHGVRVGYVAINENGLIGRVVSVGRRSARVLLLDDYNSRIPVMGEGSRVRAVLAGQSSRPPELLTRPFELNAPRLDFIVGAQSLREGELVITSGDGGIFPRGVPVGTAHRGADGVWRVALSASQRPIDFVRLVPYAGIERPEEAPVEDPGPPLSARPAIVSASRESEAAAPVQSAPAPRRQAPAPQPAPAAATPATPAPAATTPSPAPATTTPAGGAATAAAGGTE